MIGWLGSLVVSVPDFPVPGKSEGCIVPYIASIITHNDIYDLARNYHNILD